MDPNKVIAPFVMKTYHMVNDSSLDNLIRWSTSNNSFIVIDSLGFSQRLLPAYFKHNNFSSFVRQLNTYGFKKVDPDRWEFANEWFLRGQVHLLKNIGRKRQPTSNKTNIRCNAANIHIQEEGVAEDEAEIAMEIAKLKKEQKALEHEIKLMNKRLEVTERRPEQMMALLCKVAEDPEILQRMMVEKLQRSKKLTDQNKQRRLITSPAPEPELSPEPSPSSSIKFEENENEGYGNPNSSTVWLWNNDGDGGAGFSIESETKNGVVRYGSPEREVNRSPAYPFSLLGGGF